MTKDRYIFFEKKRIAEGKPKNAARLALERQSKFILTKTEIYEIKGEEVECFEDLKGKLYNRKTGKVVKLY